MKQNLQEPDHDATADWKELHYKSHEILARKGRPTEFPLKSHCDYE